MTETFFSLNDLLRRKLQTTLVIVNLALCVASTLFLLSLGSKLGLGVLSVAETKLTAGLSIIISQFIVFVGILIFVTGIVIISFLTLVMMSQRLKDIGLMKAAGCPNNLVFGYFVDELLIVTFAGCLLGVVLGIVADYTSSTIVNLGVQTVQSSINIWLVVTIFAAFFALALIVGTKTILDSTKVKPAMALSPSFLFGLSKESDFKGISKAGLVVKIAVRGLFRRKSTSLRITLCLVSVFLLLTVAVAGGIIADRTTRNWIESAIGKDMILVAHRDICNQYKLLLSRFYHGQELQTFNYAEHAYQLPGTLETELQSIHELTFELRLMIEANTQEVPGIAYGKTTGETAIVGDDREGNSLIIGVEPESSLNQYVLNGYPLRKDQPFDAVLGDTIALRMFTRPLIQNISVFDRNFQIVGVCVDPMNNGNTTYIPLETLQSLTGISKPNAIMARVNFAADREHVLTRVRAAISAVGPELEFIDINEILEKSLSFLGYIWSSVMLLPLLSLSAATMCLVSYVVLSIEEQKQEFAVLRALGAKPNAIVKIIATQNLLVLLASWATGISLGIITTLLILISEPLITPNTVLEISAWLTSALIIIFIISIYPALRFSSKPILEIIT